MGSRFSSIKNFFYLFTVIATVLTFGLMGPFGSAAAYSPYAAVFAQAFGIMGTGNGEFINPAGIDIAGDGTIYVADTDSDRVQVFNASGAYQRQITTFGSGDYLSAPRGLATDAVGNLYVADSLANRIVEFNNSGGYVGTWGSYGTGDGQFKNPYDVAVDTVHYLLYVADTDSDRVQVFNASGAYQRQITTFGSGDYLSAPRGLATDASDNLYVADSLANRIVKFDNSGGYVTKWGAYGTGDGQFKNPYDVAVDSAHNLVYVADTKNHRVQKFNLSGTFATKWGTYGSGPDQFNQPSGIAVDADGNLYVADTMNNRIKKMNYADSVWSSFGTAGSGNGQFNQPRGIAVDNEGTLYVLDTGNNRVQKLTSGGVFIAKWGASGFDNAQFNGPFAIAARTADNVLVADTTNNRVQRFEPDQDPTNIILDNATVIENKANEPVGNFNTTDANLGDTFVYSLVTSCTVSTDNSSFTINGNTLLTAAPLSLVNKATYDICVQTVDSGGKAFYKSFTITLTNANDAPVLDNQSLPPLSEAAPNGTVVGQIVASDPDTGDTLTFTKLSGAPALSVSASGEVTVTDSSLLDYETQPHLTMQVKVTDAGALSDTGVVDIYVTDANDAPVPAEYIASVPENSAVGTAIGAPLQFTDQDLPAQSMTWDIIAYQTLYTDNSIQFRIDHGTWYEYTRHIVAQNPQLYVYNKGTMDYETFPQIKLTIRLTDNGFPARYTDFTATVNLGDINEPPECRSQYNVGIVENDNIGSYIGTTSDQFRIFDPEKHIVNWIIKSGDPDGNFVIQPQGFLGNDSLAALKAVKEVPLNYEQDNTTFDLVIDVEDNNTDPRPWTCEDGPWPPEQVILHVSVYNVDEPVTLPLSSFNPQNPSVDEYVAGAGSNPAVDDLVATVHASDPDLYGTYDPGFWYEIYDGNPVGPGGARLFKMTNHALEPKAPPYIEGLIQVNNPSGLDHEAADHYDLKVRVYDRGRYTAEQTVTVNINDRNDPPAINRQTFYANSSDVPPAPLGQILVADPDVSDTSHTFALNATTQGGIELTDHIPFAVDHTTGMITVADTTRFIEGATFDLTVTAQDAGGLTGQGTVTVIVSSGNNPPIMDNQSFAVDENTANDTDVYTIVASDHEGNPITYSLVGTTPNALSGAFAINPTTGHITVADTTKLDYESQVNPNHLIQLTVRATDYYTPNPPDSKYKEATITATISNVNERPSITNTSFELVENAPAGTVVGSLGATDPDVGTAMAYTINSGNDGDTFQIASNGALKVLNSAKLDYETLAGHAFTLNVTVTDDGTPALDSTVDITITLKNVNEPALVTPASFSVNENSPKGTVVGTIEAKDQDVPPNNLIFEILSGNTDDVFAIDGTGKLTVAKENVLNSDGPSAITSYTLSVRTKDDTGDTSAISPAVNITVSVNNVDEAPVFGNLPALYIDDRSPAGLAVATLQAADPEGAVVSYGILSGNKDQAFALDTATGAITINNADAIDYSKNPLFNLTVSASDGHNIASAQVDIHITPRPDLAVSVQAPLGFFAGSRTKVIAWVKNAGYKASDSYTLTITVPSGLAFDAPNSSTGCQTSDSSVVTCGAAGMKEQSSLGYDIAFTTDASLAENALVPVAVTVQPTGDDMEENNNVWAGTLTSFKDSIPLYDESFSSNPDLTPNWTVDGTRAATLVTAPSGQMFIGQLAGNTLTYDAGLLSEHQAATVSFDLYITGDWAGNDAADGPDQWKFNLGTSQNLVGSYLSRLLATAGNPIPYATTFSNRAGYNQAYPDQYPGGNNAPFTGKTAADTLGFGTKDTTYHLAYTFNHSESTLLLNFLANLPKPGNKGWGIDNVKVTLYNGAVKENYLVFLPATSRK